MKFLRLILWPTLIFCLAWITAIILGPLLITSAVAYISKGKIEVSRVAVSPKLKITASAVNFSLPLNSGEKDLEVTSRAVSIDLNFKGGFTLIGKMGPSKLKNYGTLNSLNFTLEPISILDWSAVDAKVKFEKLIGDGFDLAQGVGTGTFINSFNSLKNAELTVSDIRGYLVDHSFEVAALGITMDKVEIGKSIYTQSSNVKYNINQIVFPESTFECLSVEGNIKLSNGEAVLDIIASNIQFVRQQTKAEYLTLSSKNLLLSSPFEGTWEFLISDIESKVPAITIENYGGYLTFSKTGFSHGGRVAISKLELKTDEYFVGQVEDGTLDVVLSGRVLPSKLGLEGNAVLTLGGVDGFSASTSIETSLLASDIFSCVNQWCGLGFLNANYSISTSGSSLNGHLNCREFECFGRPTKHVIQTDNTNKFFQSLSEVGFLNPIILPLGYMAISSGVVAGDGHILNF